MNENIFTLTKLDIERLCGKVIGGHFPEKIYCQGNPQILALPKVAIVGSRHPTLYGREVAFRFASELAGQGFLVVSGGAIGVDSIANKSALRAGTSCAVIGSGLLKPYPPSNRDFFNELATSTRGLILSQFEPHTSALKWNFPNRNITIAKLADFLLVIEAAAKSGSLITAHAALDYGLDVGALPGPVDSPNSVGTNRLIQDGAFCITTPDDIAFRLAAVSQMKLQTRKNSLLEDAKSVIDDDSNP